MFCPVSESRRERGGRTGGREKAGGGGLECSRAARGELPGGAWGAPQQQRPPEGLTAGGGRGQQESPHSGGVEGAEPAAEPPGGGSNCRVAPPPPQQSRWRQRPGTRRGAGRTVTVQEDGGPGPAALGPPPGSPHPVPAPSPDLEAASFPFGPCQKGLVVRAPKCSEDQRLGAERRPPKVQTPREGVPGKPRMWSRVSQGSKANGTG